MPITVVSAAPRIMHSKVTGMNMGQLTSGLPPTFRGYATADTQYSSEKPPVPPSRPPMSTINGNLVFLKPIAWCNSSIGIGE